MAAADLLNADAAQRDAADLAPHACRSCAQIAADVAEIKRTLAPVAALCSKAEPLLSAVTRKD